MENLALSDLKRLSGVHENICISMYMPTFHAGNEVRQNPIRFKNLLNRTEKMLRSEGLKQQEVGEYLKPVTAMELDRIFWQQQLDGLAVFRTSRLFRYYRLPLHFEELAVVGRRFHLKPLLPLFSGNGRFYMLALSQKQVRLFLGSHYSVNEVRLRGVPRGLAEAMKYEEVERQLQYHSASGAAEKSGRPPAIYHGQGAGKAEVKDQILRYLRKVEKAVHRLLRTERVPLVLAGLEYLFPIYRQANTYAHLLQDGINANADELSLEQLHEQAWKIVEPQFRRVQAGEAKRFAEFVSTDRASDDLEEIVAAAFDKRVETLFVPEDLHVWGRFNRRKRKVSTNGVPQPENEDLLDLAAVKTLNGNGTVYAVEREELPAKGPCSAIFRY